MAPPLYTGTDVGFSSLCVGKDVTYRFLDDVIGELAAAHARADIVHLGGDEAHSTQPCRLPDLRPEGSRVHHQADKRVMGWQEIGDTDLPPGSIAQYWGTDDRGPQGWRGRLPRKGATRRACRRRTGRTWT